MQRIVISLLAALFSCFTVSVYAAPAQSSESATQVVSKQKAKPQVGNPVVFMKSVADQLLLDLDRHKGQLHNQKVVSRIIYQKVVPYFDVRTMARSVLGRRFWAKATQAQRKEFIKAFTAMIVHTYASAVEQYDDDIIKFQPLRTNYKNYRLISVSSLVIRKNGTKVLVKYKLIRSNGSWRVYDFSIESISMVSSYRSQFSGVLHKSGVAGLIVRLKSHNRKIKAS